MDNFYFTQSLNMAAYLKYKGHDILKSDSINGITTFYFEKNYKVYDDVMAYNNNNELKKFISAFRKVKKMIKK